MQEILCTIFQPPTNVNHMPSRVSFRSSDAAHAHPFEAGDTSRPLIHQILPGDHTSYRDATVAKTPVLDHKDLTITDIEKDKSTLLDRNAKEEDRAKAAQELSESGIKEFKYEDEKGVEKTFKLEEETKDGKKQLKTNDGNGFETTFEYVQDEHGDWHFVPRQSAGGANSDSGSRRAAGGAGGAPEVARGGAHGGGASGGGGGGGGGGGERVPTSRPRGMSYAAPDANGVGHYDAPSGGRSMSPGGVDSHVWQGVQNTDGSVAIRFRGCQVDTDGAGARNHPEDATRQNQTSLKLSNGESLNTDTDNFFVLPPSVARAYHIKKGDLGWLVDEKTGKAVPVVFGDAGPEGKLGEASVHALKSLGFSNVSGRNGVDKSQPFKVVFVPGSGDGTGDIARDSQAMAAKLDRTGKTGSSTQVA